MTNRAAFIKEFRTETIGSVSDQSSKEEQFQNQVLRPILKLQNELFIASFANYIAKNKADFANYTLDKKNNFIENSIQKDTKYRNTLKGMVVGWFTLEEYQIYANNSSNINKRMMRMLQERLKSQIELL
ncbi:glyoxalase [Flavobacterium crassostreae]|uniref:Glyoxalase n=1 Tax=Flavobacterium crassostreae TaxID=1763534 RepID=A0A1B9E2A2_9FLAO|nr:glyoxalase [Flavobacterium crassostreae]OCB76074.1 glyoxalase [Flavobacterium crassostreae]